MQQSEALVSLPSLSSMLPEFSACADADAADLTQSVQNRLVRVKVDESTIRNLYDRDGHGG